MNAARISGSQCHCPWYTTTAQRRASQVVVLVVIDSCMRMGCSVTPPTKRPVKRPGCHYYTGTHAHADQVGRGRKKNTAHSSTYSFHLREEGGALNIATAAVFGHGSASYPNGALDGLLLRTMHWNAPL